MFLCDPRVVKATGWIHKGTQISKLTKLKNDVLSIFVKNNFSDFYYVPEVLVLLRFF